MFNMYNPQPSVDRINAQINELEKMKAQMQQPIAQPITQNFQLAPSNTIRYANSMDEVEHIMVIGETPFFSNDMSVVWIKDSQNRIRTYELNEIIKKDEKDLMIESLQMQINEMKGMINNESNVSNVSKSTKGNKSSDVQEHKSSDAE